ncbi:uncharacterized protein DSM5745_06059 [Aspergillus mulundensis]|uniref:Uncharacterized protein n=1 Tax=Aspergillus mulundensis TaxID=1810919 RepID=A0A3D8RYS0_9EURO|nr:hypothetical protein DSM5745_06059 [Aspergillus mulundensis]RDW79207.1 hypothetical protein DSM5745_06059 [Aspergillus mulundensis]
MFASQFKEGLALSKHGHLELPLPEDDPRVLKIFCEVSHHQAGMIPNDPTPEFLRRISVFIDKFTTISRALLINITFCLTDWESARGGGASVIPNSIVYELEDKLRLLAKVTENALTHDLAKLSTAASYSCLSVTNFVGAYAIILARRGIMPGSEPFRAKSFTEVVGAASEFPIEEYRQCLYHDDDDSCCDLLLGSELSSNLQARIVKAGEEVKAF